jgi:hypothetical protein
LVRTRAARSALREQRPLLRWKLASAVGLGFPPALLGVSLTAFAVLAETLSALRSETSKDVTIPIVVALAGAALYDRLIHAEDLYWEAIVDSLDGALNRRPPISQPMPEEWKAKGQQVAFN